MGLSALNLAMGLLVPQVLGGRDRRSNSVRMAGSTSLIQKLGVSDFQSSPTAAPHCLRRLGIPFLAFRLMAQPTNRRSWSSIFRTIRGILPLGNIDSANKTIQGVIDGGIVASDGAWGGSLIPVTAVEAFTSGEPAPLLR